MGSILRGFNPTVTILSVKFLIIQGLNKVKIYRIFTPLIEIRINENP